MPMLPFALLKARLTAVFSRSALVSENLALRQEMAVFGRGAPRPRLRRGDRVFWDLLRRLWSGWREALVLVRPSTVIGWHRQGFRLYWTWTSRRAGPGRPGVDAGVRRLIKDMAAANAMRGAPRVHGELLKLGIEVSQRTVGRLMPRKRKPPSQTWRAFLKNHVADMASMDFFVVPTATFRMLYVLVILRHERRRTVHVNVTEHPSAEWTAEQVVEAFPWDEAPRFLMRDRDGVYSSALSRRVWGPGIEEVKSAPRAPWQDPFVERVIGSIRRELTDHVVLLGELHLQRSLREYVAYSGTSRTHLSLDKEAPSGRDVQGHERGDVVALPLVGGLHHRYERRAA